ncbi:hypothetical protein HYS95_03385 [Candidatus Daviesbacteria bacterium]|nr:hypothetical protein [Candidatus Daviesbacteria bacterium]
MAGCERCPSPGRCGTVCPLVSRLRTVEFGKAKISVGESIGDTKELFSKESSGLREGYFIFNPVRLRQGISERPTPTKTSEKVICFRCKKSASDCSHSESNTSALKAA